MVIQCGCLDMMRAEDGKLHSQLEWPNLKRIHMMVGQSVHTDLKQAQPGAGLL